jgi:hypothetical protein
MFVNLLRIRLVVGCIVYIDNLIIYHALRFTLQEFNVRKAFSLYEN